MRVKASCPNLDMAFMPVDSLPFTVTNDAPAELDQNTTIERGFWTFPSGGSVILILPGGFPEGRAVHVFDQPADFAEWESVIVEREGSYLAGDRPEDGVVDDTIPRCSPTYRSVDLSLDEFIAFVDTIEVAADA